VIADKLQRRFGEVVALDLPDPHRASRRWPGWAGATWCSRYPSSRSSAPAIWWPGYVRDLDNTPGHLNHWSKRGFVRFDSQVAEVRDVTSPFP
jgi:hypothetical protein